MWRMRVAAWQCAHGISAQHHGHFAHPARGGHAVRGCLGDQPTALKFDRLSCPCGLLRRHAHLYRPKTVLKGHVRLLALPAYQFQKTLVLIKRRTVVISGGQKRGIDRNFALNGAFWHARADFQKRGR